MWRTDGGKARKTNTTYINFKNIISKYKAIFKH